MGAASVAPTHMVAIISPRPERIHHDFEGFSEADLKKVGSSRYARDPSTEVLMCSYAFDDRAEIGQWIPEEGQPIPAELEDAILDTRIQKHAWNAPFEWQMWKYTLGYDITSENWRCTMALALSLAFPGKLEQAGKAMNLPPDYMKKGGTALINWFCKLRPATKTKPRRRVHWHEKPDKWNDFLVYNIFDTKAERKLYRMMRRYDLPEHEWELWRLDHEINQRGIPVNVDMARNVVEIRDKLVEDKLEEMRQITGLDNPNSNEQLLWWLQSHGYRFEDVQIGHIRREMELIDEDVTGGAVHPAEVQDLYRTLELRAEVSRTSTKKFDAVLSHTDEDGRLRNCFQINGAGRTWRWAGRVIQPQNLAKPTKALEGLTWGVTPGGNKYVTGGTQIWATEMLTKLDAFGIDQIFDKPMDAISGAVRPVIQAPDGYVFLDQDLAAIENVGLGFLAGDKKILKVFEDDRDPYIDFGTRLFGRTYQDLYDEYEAGDKGPRTIAKPGVLGCGYMLGKGKKYINNKTGETEATGLLGYAWNMGIELTPEQAAHSVDTWRDTYEDTVQFWWDLQRAAFKAIRSKKPQEVRHLRWEPDRSFLMLNLPSGRNLHYYKPRIESVMAPWGKPKDSMTYMGQEKYQWKRISTHPGKLTENATQAVARDLLASGMTKAAAAGLPIVMHVHDQIIALVKEEDADDGLKVLNQCMVEGDPWSKSMPVRSSGHISKWFVKD